MANNIPLIELSGSYYEMGQQFGQEFKQQIKEFAQTRMARLISFVKRYGKTDVSEAEVLNIAESLLPIHENYDNDIWQEFLGISDGANISLAWLLVTNGYTDLRDYICKAKGFNDLEVRFEGCTGFIIDKTMSETGKAVIGQTWDMSVEAMDYLVLVRKKPTNEPSMLYLTTYGALALIGLNSHSIAVGTTNLMANDCQDGVNYLFTISKALMQTNYQACVDSIIQTTRMSGHTFLCSDSEHSNLIETSAKDYINHQVDHYPLVRTNNYSETMRQHEIFIPEQRRRNSIYRYARMLSILTEKAKWDHESLWQALADDHRNASGAAICNEDYSGKYSEFATLATVLLLPEQQQMWVCRGGVVSGHRQVIDL